MPQAARQHFGGDSIVAACESAEAAAPALHLRVGGVAAPGVDDDGPDGVRLRMLGNGRGGSFFLSVGGGMGWLRMPNFQHAGPMVTIGIEGRP